MRESRRNVLVGLFMMLGLVVLGALMVLFGEQPAWLGGAEYELKIEFKNVKGVSEGMPIHMNGVQVGRVGRMDFQSLERPDLGVEVVGLIKEEYRIPANSVGEVQPGLMGLGRGQIAILTPEQETSLLEPGEAVIKGTMGSPFGDLIPETMVGSIEDTVVQIGDLAEKAAPVAEDFHDLFEMRTLEEVDAPDAAARGVTANISTVVQRLDATVRNVNDMVGDPEFKTAVRDTVDDLRATAADARETGKTLRRTATKLETNLDRLADSLDTGLADANAGIRDVRERLVPVLDDASRLMENLDRASSDLAEGKGTLGLLLRDDRLYEKTVLAIERITDFIDTLRRMASRFEKQGYVEFKAHEAVGPLPYKGKMELEPER